MRRPTPRNGADAAAFRRRSLQVSRPHFDHAEPHVARRSGRDHHRSTPRSRGRRTVASHDVSAAPPSAPAQAGARAGGRWRGLRKGFAPGRSPDGCRPVCGRSQAARLGSFELAWSAPLPSLRLGARTVRRCHVPRSISAPHRVHQTTTAVTGRRRRPVGAFPLGCSIQPGRPASAPRTVPSQRLALNSMTGSLPLGARIRAHLRQRGDRTRTVVRWNGRTVSCEASGGRARGVTLPAVEGTADRARTRLGTPEGVPNSEKSRRRPTLPGSLLPSTIGAGGLNGRVRNGNGCAPSAIATGNLVKGHRRSSVVGRTDRPSSTP
jgi:hypothetical protein